MDRYIVKMSSRSGREFAGNKADTIYAWYQVDAGYYVVDGLYAKSGLEAVLKHDDLVSVRHQTLVQEARDQESVVVRPEESSSAGLGLLLIAGGAAYALRNRFT